MDNIRAIKTDADLAWAIAEINPYFDNPPDLGTPDADRFDVLATLIEAFENKHYHIDAPEPVELIKTHMEVTGRTQGDLAALFGSRSRASEVLNRKRALTVDMIHRLHKEWGIPAECLVEP
ncbi:MAG: type II toxin-antitoxin system HigA family antitoxin, partial [Agrobacterium vaccinii]